MPSPPHPCLRNRHSLPRAVSNGAHPSDYAARELWTAIPCDSLECRRVIPTSESPVIREQSPEYFPRFPKFDCIHHGSGPSSFENVPVGSFASRSARRTGSRAVCWTVRVPWKLLRSVAVKRGQAALTLMPVDSRAEAKARVIALSAVFDEE